MSRGTPRRPRGRNHSSAGVGVRILLLGAAVAASACEPAPGEGTIDVRSARRLTVESLHEQAIPPPERDFADATTQALPDRWPIALRATAAGAWYRATIEIAEAPREPWAIYLPSVGMNAAVWIDGVLAGSGGRMTPSPARSWSRPLLFPVPAGVLRPGTNVLDVELAVQSTYPGLLGPIFVGPDRALRPAYEWRRLWQVTAVQLTILLTAYWGCAGLLLWKLRREPPGVLASSVGCLLWAIAMLDLVARDPPLPAPIWQWAMLSALAGSVGALTVSARRFLALGSPGPDRAVLAIWLAGAIAFALALADGSPRLVQGVVLLWAFASLGVALYLTGLLFRIRRGSDAVEGSTVRYLAPLAGVALLFLVHDVALGAGLALPPQIPLIPFVGAIIGLWGGVRIVERLSNALAQSAALNRDLERRVAERGAEIARSYEQIRTLERARLLQRERERMMRDVHDGMGSQLTSTLALVESNRVSPEEVADALRDALDDMRLLVAPLGPTADDLLTLLATWRARIERRLERRGLMFDWQVADLPPLPWLGPREALNVLRIVQEAVTNIVKHANATSIVVRTEPRSGPRGEAGVVVEIGDDGAGLAGGGAPGSDVTSARADGGPRSAGVGLGNMAVRAAELGGTIDVSRVERGTRVVLWLPLVGSDAGEDPL